MMERIVIAAYCRSAFQPAHRGLFVKTRPDDLLAAVIKSLMDGVEFDPNLIEDLVVGCAFPEAEQGFNMARMAVFLS